MCLEDSSVEQRSIAQFHRALRSTRTSVPAREPIARTRQRTRGVNSVAPPDVTGMNGYTLPLENATIREFR